jgi:protein CrcB
MQAYLIVFLGAGFGGAMRHGVNGLAARTLGTGFPFGNLTVNIIGSLFMGLLAGYFALRGEASQHWRLLLTTGVLGGFTTFSCRFAMGARRLQRHDCLFGDFCGTLNRRTLHGSRSHSVIGMRHP